MRSLLPARIRTFGVLLALCVGCRSASEPSLGPDTPASLELFVSAPTATVGDLVELSARVRNSSGNILPGTVTFSVDDPSIAALSARGELVALRPGTVVISALSSPVSATARLSVVPVDTSDPGSWSFCTNAGSTCDFIGLRAVRLGAASGPYVRQIAYHTVPCAAYGFGGQNPAPNQSLHCDIGPTRTTMLNNPSPGMAGLGSTVSVPLGAFGDTVERIRASTSVPTVTDGSGSFRTTCELSKVAFDDPIFLPGQPGTSHLHVFFGNTSVRASSTSEEIASSGASTCRGGIANRTAYWSPAVIDATTGEVQIPDEGIFYYKSGYNMDPATIQPFPPGLHMIAGDKTSTAAQFGVEWDCRNTSIPASPSIPLGCPSGDFVRLVVQFPQCWDGKNLDSPDHKTHMAYPDYRNAPQRSTCPATHPVPLPAITEKFDYPVTGKNPANWRLSSDMYDSSLPGGLSAHADWMNGWRPEIMSQIVAQCVAKGVDCGVASLGNGTELY